MDARALRGWLLTQPRPVTIRVAADDGNAHMIKVERGASWAKIATTVAALQPELVEALAADGSLIRAVRPDEVAAEDAGDEDPTAIPAVLAQDTENARLIIFAKLLADAYKHTTDVAFERLANLFEASTKRSESLERTVDAQSRQIQKLILDQIQEAGADAGPGGELTLETMMSSFLQGKAQAKAKANGVPPEGDA
jgi:hypothetical protein